MSNRYKVLIAGIGGASLGTEILKCLKKCGGYEIFGCDISPYAFGHYQDGFSTTKVVDRQDYVASVLELCRLWGIQALIPGGEEPMVLLGRAADQLSEQKVFFASNSPEVISVCSDKQKCARRLAELGFASPQFMAAAAPEETWTGSYPCIVKPATGTGGSSMVFLASSAQEAQAYVRYIISSGSQPLIQEYVPVDEGEFTVGVLSLPDGSIAGSVAMQRLFHTKLSVAVKTPDGLISSGYSQGLIDDFPGIRRTCEQIAEALGSKGPLNVQGRMKKGVFLPFEINPRFSASTYLRAMAGVNEVDVFLKYLLTGAKPSSRFDATPGYYLRSLAEVMVAPDMAAEK